MRRLIALLAVLLMAAALAVSFSAPAQAAAPITGRLVDAYNSDAPIAGVTIRLRRVIDAGTAGGIITSAVTAVDGTFTLTPTDPAAAGYFVHVVAGRYQGGYVGAAPFGVKPTPAQAVMWAPGAAIGDVQAIPAFAQGQVVNAATLLPVSGVLVSARDILDRSIVLASAVTNADGRFRLNGIAVEEIALRFNGNPVGYELGFASCTHRVVPTWGAACSAGTGYLGRFHLDPL